MRTKISIRAAAGAIAVATLVVSAAPPAGAAAPIPHPTETDTVILRVESSRNGFGGEYDDGDGVTIYSNRVVIESVPTSPVLGATDSTLLLLDEAAVQRALRAARRAGLLRAKEREYGDAGVTDQGTTVVDVHAGGVERTISVYALLLPEGDRGVTARQRAARRALRTFVHTVTNADLYRAANTVR